MLILDIFFVNLLVHLSILISFTSSRASCPFYIISCFLPLLPGFLSLRKEEPLPELFPQTPVSGYSWPRRTQVADKVVSPSCFRSSLPPCPLCHSYILFLFIINPVGSMIHPNRQDKYSFATNYLTSVFLLNTITQVSNRLVPPGQPVHHLSLVDEGSRLTSRGKSTVYEQLYSYSSSVVLESSNAMNRVSFCIIINVKQSSFPAPDCLTDIRQNLAAPRLLGKDGSTSCNLADLLHTMSTSVLDQIKSVLANLQVSVSEFIQTSRSRVAEVVVILELQAFEVKILLIGLEIN